MDEDVFVPVQTASPAKASPPSLEFEALAPSALLARILNGSNDPWPASASNPSKPMRPTTDDAVLGVALAINARHHLLYVTAAERCYQLAEGSEYLYRFVNDEVIKRWVLEVWNQGLIILGAPSPKKIKDCIEMVKNYTEKTEPEISRRYISVTPTLFWDTEMAELTDSPKSACYFKLFDTPTPTQHFLAIPPFTPEQVSTLEETYARDLEYLESHRGDLREEYDFVTLWADYNHDVYMDILKMVASPFMRRKPFGAFMLSGLKRNGKTAVSNDLMKTMLGTANCSDIQLAELGDHHKNAALQWTLYNAPDEESEKPTQYATLFKTLCDHGELKVTRLYSQEPIKIDANFVCVFPMNHKPVWKGSGAAACVARSLIIEFTHSFDEEDKNPVKFSERTFTADLFSRLLGTAFAIAHYYHSRSLTFSPTMKYQQQTLEDEMDSHTTYYNHFIAFFDGFQSINQIYEDYVIWCRAHDVPISPKPAFKLAFGAFTASGNRKKLKAYGKESRGCRIVQPGKKPLLNQAKYSVGVPSVLWNGEPPLSVVERMEAALEEKFGDSAVTQMESLITIARRNMASVRIEEGDPGEQEVLDGIFEEEA